jgi:hypothetical protein
MNITIKVENASEEYITFSKANLKPTTRRYIWSCCFYSGIGLACFLLGLANDITFLSGFGCAFLFIGVAVYVQLTRYEQNYFLAVEKSKQLLYKESQIKITIVTNDQIVIESPFLREELKWPLVTSYMLTNEYILLIVRSSFAHAVKIRKSLLTQEEQQELLTFLEKNKPLTMKADKPL